MLLVFPSGMKAKQKFRSKEVANGYTVENHVDEKCTS